MRNRETERVQRLKCKERGNLKHENVDALVSSVGAKRKGGEEEQEQNRVVVSKATKVTKRSYIFPPLDQGYLFYVSRSLGLFPICPKMLRLNQRLLWELKKNHVKILCK